MSLWNRFRKPGEPVEPGAHLRLGRHGEDAARAELERLGMKVLCANYRHRRGEIDLIAKEGEVLVFVEVKSRSSESWVRPSQAVGRPKQRLLSDTALAYLNELGRPQVAFRFDIVEVLFDGPGVREVRHIPDAFPLAEGRMYR
jgi:putative endonuclease